MTLRLLSLLFALVLSMPQAAHADCTNPAGKEAEIIYNGNVHMPQFCDGTHWWAMKNGGGLPDCAAGDTIVLTSTGWGCATPGGGGGGGGLTGPSGCANIGDLCADGTVFAGWNPVTQDQLFIPTTDQGTTSKWKTSTGANDIATDSIDNGRSNTDQVANSTTFPAFKLCKDLTTGGHSDWYLPSRVELSYLWAVRGTIEAEGNITNFQNAIYWSSAEYDSNGAWFQHFGDGTQDNDTKTVAYRVRCMRR